MEKLRPGQNFGTYYFHVAVHANSQVPMVQKFAHLKSLLRGEAAKCIASIPTTAVNYDVAVDRL